MASVKVEIDLDDVMYDAFQDDTSMSDELARSIRVGVVAAAKEMYKKSIDAKVEKVALKEVGKWADEHLNDETKNVLNKKEFKIWESDEKGLTLTEHIKNQFVTRLKDNSRYSDFERIAAELARDLKQRYDLVFASKVVAKLGDAGLLKDDIAKLVLQDYSGK